MLREEQKKSEEKIGREVKTSDSTDSAKLIVNPKKRVFNKV